MVAQVFAMCILYRAFIMYDSVKLKRFCSAVMQMTGLSAEESELFAESLVSADMRGVASHGVTRLTAYSRRVAERLVDPHARMTVIGDGGSLLLLDGNNAIGVTTAYRAMTLCIERAKENGLCFASVRGGNHFGYAAFYTELAAKNGMIGVAMSNAPAAMAPTGGKKAIIGTNPLSVAIPAKSHRPFVLDMATSVVARGKVTLAKKEGHSIPLGWGVDSDGKPTRDPARVSTVLPFGGVKGYAISIIIEVLCSCLSGAKDGLHIGSMYDYSGTRQDCGFFVGAIDYARIMPAEVFERKTAQLFETIKNSPCAEGCDEIYIPGEIEWRRMDEAREKGISFRRR